MQLTPQSTWAEAIDPDPPEKRPNPNWATAAPTRSYTPVWGAEASATFSTIVRTSNSASIRFAVTSHCVS